MMDYNSSNEERGRGSKFEFEMYKDELPELNLFLLKLKIFIFAFSSAGNH